MPDLAAPSAVKADMGPKPLAVRLGAPHRHRMAHMMLLGALVNLNKRPYYIHWGVVQLSLANVIVIGLMVVVFVAAVIAPFPKDRDR
jgi:hypothetical protein